MQRIIAFYHFYSPENLPKLRKDLLDFCRNLDIKGTILLADEGLNGTVAGTREATLELQSHLQGIPGLEDIEFKESFHESTTFRRMLVKIKKEIITMRKDAIDPQQSTGKYLDPKLFKEWQQQGKELLIVDTRNTYEVELGTFEGAIDPQIASFGDFPEWVENNLADAKDKTVVTFCTGGIRCEKATAFMQNIGFKDVYQLKGGILKYLEVTKEDQENNYWNGECVVFDKRMAVDKKLAPTKKQLCYVCLTELSEANFKGHHTPAGKACVKCHDLMQAAHDTRVAKGNRKHQQHMEKRQLHGEKMRSLNLQDTSHS